MKKLLSILFMIVSVQVFAQDNPITAITISLPTNPDANTADWGTGGSLFVISAKGQMANGRINPILEESRILVIIQQNGKKVCGAYTSNSAPAADFNTMTKVWSGGNAASLLGKDCTLPPGDYEISVRFFGAGPAGTIPLSDEKTKAFTIRGNDQQAYQPPQGIMPADGTSLAEADIKKPITFRWTPVIPKPQDPVTYRLSVWQQTQGQTGPQTIKANQPIIIKDVDNLTQVAITNIVDGPCKPPLMCKFVWTVQALNREGKPVGGNNGTSEAFAFKVGGTQPGDMLSNPNLHQNQGYLTVGDNKGTAKQEINLENGQLKQNPQYLTAGDNKGTAKQQISLENGQLKQNPQYLTAGDNKGTAKQEINLENGQLKQNPQYLTAGDNKGTPAQQSHFIKGAIKHDPQYLTAGDNKASPAQKIDLENGQLKQNPQYLTAGDNKGTPAADDFRRDVDNKGRPSSIIYGGIVEIKPGNNRPVFHWKVNNPLPGQTYSLKIVEIHEKQSPEEAIETNTPVFEEKGIKETSFAYPARAHSSLDKGPVGSHPSKQYAWVVTSWDSNGKQSGQKQYILGVNMSF